MRASDIRERFAALAAQHDVKHLVWVGAHQGEEVPHLLAAGIPRLTLVEPIPALAAQLRRTYPDVEVVECACSDSGGTATLHVPAKTNMASLVSLPGHTIEVQTRRLDEIAPQADAAVIDVQGAEYAVLAAAPWHSLRLVMVETVDGVEDPTLAPTYETMCAYMTERGYREVARYGRDYDFIQKWAYGRKTTTGAHVYDVVYVRR